MTNESPGYTPSWIRHTEPVDSPAGEVLPESTQDELRAISEVERIFRNAGLSLDRFGYEMHRVRAELFNAHASQGDA